MHRRVCPRGKLHCISQLFSPAVPAPNDPGRIWRFEASQTGLIAPLYLLSLPSTHLLRLGGPLAAMAGPFMAGRHGPAGRQIRDLIILASNP